MAQLERCDLDEALRDRTGKGYVVGSGSPFSFLTPPLGHPFFHCPEMRLQGGFDSKRVSLCLQVAVSHKQDTLWATVGEGLPRCCTGSGLAAL